MRTIPPFSISGKIVILCSLGLLSGCNNLKPLTDILPSDPVIHRLDVQRADFREQKVAFIKNAMNLSGAQNDAFWKEYYQYEAELKRLNDERVSIIHDYSAVFNTMDDAKADNLARRSLKLRQDRDKLYTKYYDRIKTATSPVVAAKFLQIENEINLLIDLKVATGTPLLPSDAQPILR